MPKLFVGQRLILKGNAEFRSFKFLKTNMCCNLKLSFIIITRKKIASDRNPIRKNLELQFRGGCICKFFFDKYLKDSPNFQ